MHKITRRLLFERFLPSLACMADEVDARMNRESKQGYLQQSPRPVDVLNLFSAITMDFVSAYQFGMANGTNMSGEEQKGVTFNASPAGIRSEEFFDLYRSRQTHTFWPQEHPNLTRFLRYIGVRLVPRFVNEANAKIEDMLMRMCDAAAATIYISNKEGELTDRKDYERVENTPVVYAQLSESLSRNEALRNQKLVNDIEDKHFEDRRRRISSELLDHLAAGFETSGITLTYATYELSRHQDIQEELREELRSLGNSTKSPLTSYFTSNSSTLNSSSSLPFTPSPEIPLIPDAKLIDELPLLHAILLETLRLHSAIPGPQPRVTPLLPKFTSLNRQGSTKDICAVATATATKQSTALAGYDNIPAGVRVSAQAYSLHRNADVFPDPESWIPHRWLTSSIVDDQRRKRYRLRGSKGRSNSNSNNDGRRGGSDVNTPNDEEDVAIKEMYRWFWAFGSGGRMCVGSNLAMYRVSILFLFLLSFFFPFFPFWKKRKFFAR